MISPTQLENWLAEGESETQEFKKSIGQRSRAAETLCAFINHQGGRVIFGVDNDGAIVGMSVGNDTIEKISHEIQTIEPPVFPTIDVVSWYDGQHEKKVVVVTATRGAQVPYAIRGTAFKRVGKTTLRMDAQEYNRVLLERLHSSQRWENQVAEGWSVNDLDQVEILRAYQQAIAAGRLNDALSQDPSDILRGFGLLNRHGELLRAAVVLFGQETLLQSEFPQCQLRVARFRGVDKTAFLDNHQYTGHAFALMRRAERYLIDHLPIAGRIVPNLFERQDDPLYPLAALREALANAFCHRDYHIGGGSVGIALYDDRLEITSSGTLHFGLTVADLYQAHASLPWNPLIAGVFYRRGLIEAWGRGTLKIVELTEQAGLPRPDIEMVSGAVTVRFLPSRYVAPQRTNVDLTDSQRAILQVLEQRKQLAAREVYELVGKDTNKRHIKRELARLKDWGLIDVRGHGRGAYWFLKPITE